MNIFHMNEDETEGHGTEEVTRTQAWALYLSHFLSMWTSRSYEYAAILFIQHTFPGDLLPSSINGIAETVCVLVSSTALGKWVDQNSTRLRPLVLSILYNRLTLVLCCFFWCIIFLTSNALLHNMLFVIILLLGMVEKASRMSNTLSVERDWIPTIASISEPLQKPARLPYTLTYLNTIIRRIDIVCKFLSPLVVAGLLAIAKPWLAAILVGLISATSCLLELWCAHFVWRCNRRLRRPKLKPSSAIPQPSQFTTSTAARLSMWSSRIFRSFLTQLEGVQYYFSTEVWVPSFGTAILHASVLAWSGTMITWLLNRGFTYGEVSVAKGIGSAFELGSTFLFSWMVSFLSKQNATQISKGAYQMISAKPNEDEDTDEQGDIDQEHHSVGSEPLIPIVLTAKWSILTLVTCLIPALIALLALDQTMNNPTDTPNSSNPDHSSTLDPMSVSPVSALTFLAFLSFSFLGRWTYDLSITQLTQITIPAERRSEFGGAEMAFVSLISLGHWIAAAIWHKQSDFKWLAVGSVVAVAIAASGYVFWTAKWRRGTRGT